MYELLVIPFDSVAAAEAAREQLVALASRYLVYVADAVVATGDGRHHIRLQHLVDQWPPDPAGTPVWGTLAGMFQRHSLVAASARSSAGGLDNFGLDDAFMEGMASLLDRRAACLCVLARASNADHVVERVGGGADEVLRARLRRSPATCAESSSGSDVGPKAPA
ncbi:MAG: DUF1269 domain-containing protein [Rhodocyclaceae bacterium]|nr:DUF1269 domain-containing protein [Rhodocyclaceae bacterium]